MNPAKALFACAALLALAAAPARAVTPDALPSTTPESFGLAIIDVETTGLDQSFHEMIDFGVIYADLQGCERGRLYVRIMPDHPERLDPIAKSINGFDVAYWTANGAVPEAEAVARIAAFHETMAGDRKWIFTAYNASFDVGFVGALLKQHGRNWRDLWHWNPLDLPSVAWGMGHRQLRNAPVGAVFGMAPETSVPLDHTGLSGAEWNLELYRRMVEARGEAAPCPAKP